MLHGLIYAQHAHKLNVDPGIDFRSEVRSYFATGTQLEEMYVTPSLLTSSNWNAIAESAKWARLNADVLRDVHWIGGDPAKLEVYGWAAWTPRKSIITLRNPSASTAAFSINPDRALELPVGHRETFTFQSPWADTPANVTVATGHSSIVVLKPFEVLTLESVAK